MLLGAHDGDTITFGFIAIAGDQPPTPEYTRFEICVFEMNGETMRVPREMEIALHTAAMHNGDLYAGRQIPEHRLNTIHLWCCRLEQGTEAPLVSMQTLANTGKAIPTPFRPVLAAMRNFTAHEVRGLSH